MLLEMVKQNKVDLDFSNYAILLRGGIKSGKDLRNGTPVLTNRGWVPIEELTTNDLVYGLDGQLHNVLGVFPQGKRQCYKLTFSDGTTAESSATHLWEVIERVQYKHKSSNLKNTVMKVRKVMELQEILKVVEARGYQTHKLYRFELPLLENEIAFPEKELPINPYLLGLLLGDGGFTTNNITFTNTEDDIVDKFKKIVDEEYGHEVVQHASHKIQYRVKVGDSNHTIKDDLENLGLLHKLSGDKFIPEQYLFASVEQRWQLLRGLLDTDGSIKTSGNPVFTSTSKQLCEDVMHLARSLKAVCTMSIDKRKDRNECYNVNIMFEDNSLSISSVKHAEKIINKCKMSKLLVNIEKTDVDDTTCIFVNAPRHLFIIKDFILTHNTTLYHEIIKAKYGTPNAGLLIPFEKGYSAINGLNVFPITILPTTTINGTDRHGWDVFTDIVKEVIATRETNGIKVLCIDTVDEFMTVVQNKVCKLSAIETKKPCKSINDSFGGFGRGRARVAELIKEQIQKLRNAGIGIFFIGHTKYKTLKTKVDKEEYNVLGSNLTEDYDKMIANDMDMVLMITQEPEIKDGIIVGNQRKIRFRSDGFYDVGSRFQYVPDYMDYSESSQETAKNFIAIIEDAIKKSADIQDDKEFQSQLKEQQMAHETEIKNNIQHELDTKVRIIEALTAFTSDPNTTQAQKVRFAELKKMYNVKFKEPNTISMEVLMEFVNEFNLKY